MNTLLMLAAAGYIIFAIASIWSRPGLFAAAFLLTYGLAVFFGSIGPIAGATSIIVSVAAMNAQKRQHAIIPGEYAFILWLGMLTFSLFTTPVLDLTLQYVASVLLLAAGSYLYARTFATSPRFFEDLLFGGLFITTLCTAQLFLSTRTLQRLGDTLNMSPVGLAVLPELCLVGVLAYLLFHRAHSRIVTVSMLLCLFFVLAPLTMALGTRSLILSVGIVFLILLMLRAWHGNAARLFLGLAGGAASIAALVALFWSNIQTTKLGLLITLGAMRLTPSAGMGSIQADPSAMTRLQLYDSAWNIFYRNPIFGSGAGAFGYLADDAAGAYPHNMILEILVQSGVAGLLLFLAFCASLVLKGSRDVLQKPASWTAIFSLSLLVSGIVRLQVSMSITTGKLLFFALGCIAARLIAEKQALGLKNTSGDNSAISYPDTSGSSLDNAAPPALKQ
jgi:O-antigen ligase